MPYLYRLMNIQFAQVSFDYHSFYYTKIFKFMQSNRKCFSIYSFYLI